MHLVENFSEYIHAQKVSRPLSGLMPQVLDKGLARSGWWIDMHTLRYVELDHRRGEIHASFIDDVLYGQYSEAEVKKMTKSAGLQYYYNWGFEKGWIRFGVMEKHEWYINGPSRPVREFIKRYQKEFGSHFSSDPRLKCIVEIWESAKKPFAKHYRIMGDTEREVRQEVENVIRHA
jgi:hypothetical protein